MVIKRLMEVRNMCNSKQEFQDILKAVEDDIKFNRVGFNKTTGSKKFIEILNITVGIMLAI